MGCLDLRPFVGKKEREKELPRFKIVAWIVGREEGDKERKQSVCHSCLVELSRGERHGSLRKWIVQKLMVFNDNYSSTLWWNIRKKKTTEEGYNKLFRLKEN